MIGLPVVLGQALLASDVYLLIGYAALAGAIIHAKYMFKWLTPNELLGSRFLLAGMLLVGYVLVASGPATFVDGAGGAWLALIFSIVIGGIVVNTLFYRGISKIRAEQAAPLMYIDPMSAAVLATLLLGETLDITALVGVAVIIIGVFISFPHHHRLMHHYFHPSPHRLKNFWRRLTHRY